MENSLIAKAETSISASTQDVWKALTAPEAIKEYWGGAIVKSDWKVGSAITWSGVYEGKAFEDKGEILAFDPDEQLAYSHFSPMSGKADSPENYHKVFVTLSEVGETETRVSLEQDNNANEKSRDESEKNWNGMLNGLKKYVEGSNSSTAGGAR